MSDDQKRRACSMLGKWEHPDLHFTFPTIKTIRKTDQNVPMQLTAVWTCNDLFGVKGLKFDGFADFWWETHGTVDGDGKAKT